MAFVTGTGEVTVAEDETFLRAKPRRTNSTPRPMTRAATHKATTAGEREGRRNEPFIVGVRGWARALTRSG